MYKVVIIDDEPIIVEGLSRALAWEKWDCQVVGFAYNGKEGMELIRKEKPDILISDISMPQLDGLKMIAGLKSEFPQMQITILTGFRKFEYAREAIQLGVARFLLKPSKMDELREAIQYMTDRLKEQQSSAVSEQMCEQDSIEESEQPEKEEILYNNAANNFIVTNALNYIRENYKEKLRLIDVADQIYVSQWHLSKLLNKHTGQTFSDILNGIRMEQARELLKDPSLHICDIAEEVGFQDLAHFSRVFKKQEGMSANEYRNKIR